MIFTQKDFTTAQLGDILYYMGSFRGPDQSIDECLEDFTFFVRDRCKLHEWWDRRQESEANRWLKMNREERLAEMQTLNEQALSKHREEVMGEIEGVWRASDTLVKLIHSLTADYGSGGAGKELSGKAQATIVSAVQEITGALSSRVASIPYNNDLQEQVLALPEENADEQ